MKKHKVLEDFFFWFPILTLSLPLFILFSLNKSIEKSIVTPLPAEWSMGQEVKSTPFFLNSFPVTLENKLSDKMYSLENPALLLGQAGDYDETYINDCKIGTTSRVSDNKLNTWWWGYIRVYDIPKNCIQKINIFKVTMKSFSTMPQGLLSEKIGIVENNPTMKRYVALYDFFRFKIILIYALLIFTIGVYYLYVYCLVPEKKYNLIFSLLCFSVSVFESFVSTIPYRFFQNQTLMMMTNFVGAVCSAFFFLKFLDLIFKLNKRTTINIFMLISLFFVGCAAIYFDFSSVSKIYRNWYPILLITFIYFYIVLISKSSVKEMKLKWRYFLGISVLVVCSVADVLISVTGYTTVYLIPYGFAFLLIASALALAKEYADAFLYVEAQVGERTKDLSSALEQLRGLEKMKERFFANVSHDLKTPITIALGAIEETKIKFATVVGKFLDPADRSLRRLQDMVLGILDTVKAESGTLQLDWKSVKVTDFLEAIVEPYKSLCAREGVTLRFSSKGFEGLYVPMDAKKIERVIENLLSNAFKFTKKTTRPEKIIEIELQTDQSKLYIHIDDSGIGIPETEREMVFERYFQSSRTDLREHGGSGIGLSFVKEMILLHNGHVYAAESPYHGTRFTIELPLSQNIESIQSYRIEDVSEQQLRGSLDVEYPPTTPAELNPAWSTILVAEDNPEVAQIVYSTLKDHYNIYFAEHGRRALQLMGEQSFDCVISDIEMPEMRGDELVIKIREGNKTKSIPVIMLSSHGDDDTIVKLLKLGANDYVSKPFRREILLSRISAQISAYKGTTWNTKLEKLQELGQLVSGIGHQGKNRISRVGSNYPLLIKISKDLAKKLEATNPDEGKRLYEKVSALGDLIGKGYEQTLGLFKAIDRYASGSDKKTIIPIEEIITDTLTLLDEKIRLKNASVEVQGIQGLAFEGYNEIREAILNIVSNSVDAIVPNEGQIMIEGSDKGKEIMISIRDNGSGILKENLSHVFEPFFTSKKVGEGTGLGLYLARDAVELKNHGKLTITSPGKGLGSTVHIRLPKLVPDVQHTRPTMHNVDV